MYFSLKQATPSKNKRGVNCPKKAKPPQSRRLEKPNKRKVKKEMREGGMKLFLGDSHQKWWENTNARKNKMP